MEYLSEDHLKRLLHQEWLVKIDNDKATPYLLKFYVSLEELSCCLMITDTKNVWGEVLSGNAFARRWRDSNSLQSNTDAGEDKENEWRKGLLELLTNVHSIGGIADLSFEVVPSLNADLAFELGSDEFKWRWETYALGPKLSADVLSKQLIMPLISVSHLAFSSSDPVSELSDTSLQMAIDKTGRTGRRAVDTHVKHAISRPRLTTTMRRMSAVFNFLTDLPPIVSKVETPDFVVPKLPQSDPVPAPPGSPVPKGRHRMVSPDPSMNEPAKEVPEEPVASTAAAKRHADEDSDSVTEPEEDEPVVSSAKAPSKGKGRAASPIPVKDPATPTMPKEAAPSANPSPKRKESSTQESTPADSGSGSQADVVRPSKRLRKDLMPSSSSDEDSDAEPKRRTTQSRNAPRGTKQPIKRGGRRF